MELSINGEIRSVAAEAEMPLLHLLRDRLGLTGAKFGCGVGVCHACIVHIDGEPIRSCGVTAAEAAGRRIETVEGVSGRVAEAVLAAWEAHDVAQCGFCQPAQVMAVIALLSRVAAPSDADLDGALHGVICRCATYARIRAAAKAAAASLA